MDDPWPVIEQVVEYETGWYSGGYDLVEQPDGSTKRYYWARLPPAVVIVAIVGEELLFIEQYRPTIREHHLELPAGIVESGEGYEEAARRELREETGYVAGSLTLVQTYQVATGVLDHERGVVVAKNLTEGEIDHDENEFLTVRRIPIDEAVMTAREQPANDSTISALLLATADGHLERKY